MIVNSFEVVTPKESAVNSAQVFSGVLDSPTTRKAYDGSSLIVSGWIMPIDSTESYQVLVEGSFGVISGIPHRPRPDVAKKLGAMPLAGQDQFCGFYIEVPFSPEIKVSVQFSSGMYHWKTLTAFQFHSDLPLDITALLAHGAGSGLSDKFTDLYMVSQALNYLDSSTKVCRFSNVDSLELGVDEKRFFLAFADFLSSASLFHDLLSVNRNSAPGVPAPFSSGESTLLGSIFHNINFMIFDFGAERFYLGQNLHSADFVYFPARSFVFILPNALYNHAHLKGLMSYAVRTPSKLAAGDNVNVSVSEVAINGVSPYHFFYDSMPAIDIASRKGGLKFVDKLFAINSRCYADLQAAPCITGELLSATEGELCELSRGVGFDALCLSGVSYKALAESEISQMDRELMQRALKVVGFSERYAGIDSHKLVLWIGISQQKRAWLNQKEALVAVLTRLYQKNSNMCVVFDGMTADVFGDTSDKNFFEDASVVSGIVESLPGGLTSYSLVGCGSEEKMYVSDKCDFFIANYSTGSMYPARFCGLPGVAHLSNSMLEAVRSIHIHPNTQLVPSNLVVDVPDETCGRIDFVSYEIDESKFSDFVEKTLYSTFNQQGSVPEEPALRQGID